MKPIAVSLQRRQIMIASLAGVAAPALLTSSGSRAGMSALLNVAPRTATGSSYPAVSSRGKAYPCKAPR